MDPRSARGRGRRGAGCGGVASAPDYRTKRAPKDRVQCEGVVLADVLVCPFIVAVTFIMRVLPRALFYYRCVGTKVVPFLRFMEKLHEYGKKGFPHAFLPLYGRALP